jgi:hypothetical protein
MKRKESSSLKITHDIYGQRAMIRMQREPQDKKNSLDESCLSKYNCRRKED